MATNGRDFVLEIIEKFRSHECLWQVANENYHDKTKRNAALDDILTLFRTKDPQANRETVQKKLQSMRCSYNKEYRKVKASETTGCPTDSVHVPKLWYYSYLSFLKDQDIPRISRTGSSILDDLPFGEDESIDSIDDDTQQIPQSTSSSLPTNSKPMSSFKRPQPKVDIILEKIAKRMNSSMPISPVDKPRQPHDAFGEYVSEKLRCIEPSMVPFCQKIINDALFLAEMGTLNLTSQIVTDPLAPSHRPLQKH